ncbi:hypothetical protein BDV24DRAFT_131726 [Aspergillus arachidicola]|uniref:Uncharacterized protein n=1 Tax=Aspergillus arachidicola TaxID=656916 RepID=A0A5N6Y828_9EURO|nr:hypothetical protein BDV24DRAFT_131726 [Aspergillus arachidicola]
MHQPLPVIALANRNLSCSAYFAAMMLFSSFYGTRITAGYDYTVMIQHSPDLPPVAPDLTSTVRKGSREPWISTLDH